jgi:hypothetical protein
MIDEMIEILFEIQKRYCYCFWKELNDVYEFDKLLDLTCREESGQPLKELSCLKTFEPIEFR